MNTIFTDPAKREELDKILACTANITQKLEFMKHQSLGTYELIKLMRENNLSVDEMAHRLDWNYEKRTLFEALIPKQ